MSLTGNFERNTDVKCTKAQCCVFIFPTKKKNKAFQCLTFQLSFIESVLIFGSASGWATKIDVELEKPMSFERGTIDTVIIVSTVPVLELMRCFLLPKLYSNRTKGSIIHTGIRSLHLHME